MKNLSATIQSYKEDENIIVNFVSNKLEQPTRNRLKRELTAALLADLEAMDVDNIVIERVEKGIGVAFLTPKGFIPINIEITMKSIDKDVRKDAQAYADKLVKAEEKRLQTLEANRAKIEADNIKREKKRAERAAKEAAKLAELEARANKIER